MSHESSTLDHSAGILKGLLASRRVRMLGMNAELEI